MISDEFLNSTKRKSHGGRFDKQRSDKLSRVVAILYLIIYKTEKMKVILFGFFLITGTHKLIAQNTADTLQQYVMNNKQKVKNQIEHIRNLYNEFNNNPSTYTERILVNPLKKRETNLLIDYKKLTAIGSEASRDWIKIYTYKKDTFCTSLDYFESYYFDANDNLVKIRCDQGDYPDDFHTSLTEYYFDNNKLIFVYYNETSNPTMTPRSIVNEGRYYYLDNRPIRCLARNNADINKEIGVIENKEIKLAEGFSSTEKAKELLDKLRTMRVIKN